MKQLSVLVILAISSFSWAQSRPGLKPGQPLRPADQVVMTGGHAYGGYDRDQADSARRLARNVLEQIEMSADRLDRQQLGRVNELLRDISMTLAGNVTQPPPYVPPQPPMRRSNVSGAIEGMSFSFAVVDLQELHSQCSAFVNGNKLLSVDDISMSVDFGQVSALRNSASYWKGTNSICNQIIQTAKQQGISFNPYNGHMIIGTIEGIEFNFLARDIGSLANQCNQFLADKRIVQVDDIVLSLDLGVEVALKNSASYWKNSFEICQQILQNVR